MIIITGSVSIAEESRDEAFRIGCEHSIRSRNEPGCISHNCYVDAEDPGKMHFFERWESAKAVKDHFAVPESGMFVRRLSELSVSPPEMSIFNAEAVDASTL